MSSPRLGIENLMEPARLSLLAGARVGLITNPTGTDSRLRSSIDLLAGAQQTGGFTLKALFGPEHGVRGAVPAGADVADSVDPRTWLPVRSLYGPTLRPSPQMITDIDTLIFDIQDIGARFYTYVWTLFGAMEVAADQGIRVLVLDRPNPLGTELAGFLMEEELASFVGLRPIPLQHGLTVGELARLFNGEFLGGRVDLEVIAMSGDGPAPRGTGIPWVPPSPNIPTLETAIAYPGTGLLEALNVSEGRGTTTPFLWFGAPFLTETHADEIITALHAAGLPGMLARPMVATPTASTFAGELCGGVQLHITDPVTYQPARTGIHVLAALLRTVPEAGWREGDENPAGAATLWIDALSGTRRVRQMLEAGEEADAIVEAWQPEVDRFAATAHRYRLYGAAQTTG